MRMKDIKIWKDIKIYKSRARARCKFCSAVSSSHNNDDDSIQREASYFWMRCLAL